MVPCSRASTEELSALHEAWATSSGRRTPTSSTSPRRLPWRRILSRLKVMKNTKRAALVWLDEHLEDYYRKESVEETGEERWPQVPYARKIQVRCSIKVSYLRASWMHGSVARRVTSRSG